MSDHLPDEKFHQDLVIANLDLALTNAASKEWEAAKKCAGDAIKVLLKLIPKETILADAKYDPIPAYSIWTHFKGGTYVVLSVTTCRTNGERDGKEVCVSYLSIDTGNTGHREISEFLERFSRVK